MSGSGLEATAMGLLLCALNIQHVRDGVADDVGCKRLLEGAQIETRLVAEVGVLDEAEAGRWVVASPATEDL